jgi:RHS repeat-associated protein
LILRSLELCLTQGYPCQASPSTKLSVDLRKRKPMRLPKQVAVFVFFVSSVCFAQVSTGTPAFGSFGGGPFDTVNLGNLNVHFSIPILHKAGRGLPFTYDLSYDSLIWQPRTVNGTVQWVPSSTWGWTAQSLAEVGYLSITENSQMSAPFKCGGSFATNTTYTDTYVYFDWNGKTHPFPGSTYRIEEGGACTNTTYGPKLVAQATDGSGFTLSANANQLNDVVTTRFGAIVNTNVGFNGGNGAYQDSNGNKLTYSSSTRQFFDTLSSTTPVLTLGGSGTPSSPNTYTYIAPSGANATYTVFYAAYSVATNFGFGSLIKDVGPFSVNLVNAIQLPDGSEYQFTYEQTPGSCTPVSGTSPTCVTGRIASVTLPTGGEISYTYSGPNNGIFSDGSTAGLSRQLSPGGPWSYTRQLQSGSPGPGPGSLWSTTVVDPAGNYTMSNFAEDGTTNGTSTVATYNLYETQRLAYQGAISGNACSSTITNNCLLLSLTSCYNNHFAGCATATVNSPISQTDYYSQPAGGNVRLSEKAYNPYGLLTEAKEYDYGVTLGAAPSSTYLKRDTVVTYNTSLSNGIIDRPASVVVKDGSGTVFSNTSYSYDQGTVSPTTGTPQLASVSGSRGNLTTIANQANSGTTLYQTASYYDTGNVNQSTGSSTSTTTLGPTTTFNYGAGSCGNSFATSISEPLALSRSTVWDCGGGVATQTTDENGQTRITNFTDPYFWRPANVYDQQNNETTISYAGSTALESTLTFNAGQSVLDARATVDGFGRPILSQTLQGPSASNYDTSQTDFNTVGLPSRSTLPFSASAGGTSSSAPGVTTTYDALGRPLSVADSGGGSTSYSYIGNDVLVTLSGSQTLKKQLEYDGLGRLTSVCEVSTTLSGVGTCGQSTTQTGYWTKYTYDALGHMLTVTQNAQAASNHQSRSYSFDMLGRMTAETNPESGTTHYFWDAAPAACFGSSGWSVPGNLGAKEDNVGVYTCYGYDALNRLQGLLNTANTNCVGYTYDSATPPAGVTVQNTKGRLVSAYTNSACNGRNSVVVDEWFSYSPRGELTDVYEATPHSGGYYHTSAAYWPSGTLQTLSGIPSVPTLYYGASNNGGAGLDGEGRYTQVTAASGTNPMTHVSYSTSSTTSILGAIVGITFGSGDGDTFGYDQNTGRQTSYKAYLNGTITDGGTLSYNRNGMLATLAITDNISGTNDSQSCSFTYDDLGRLGGRNANGYSVDCGAKWQQLFTYDVFGNIAKSGSSSFAATYTLGNNNQFTLAGPPVQYDGDGNLLTDNLNTYTWEPNWGQMASVNGISAIYDALGRVVEQQNGSAYAQMLYSPVGKVAIMNGTSLTKAFVGLPGGGTAVYTSSGLAYYRHPDWLGSSRLASTPARGLYSSTAYAPFGEQYATAVGTGGAADPSFTSQNSDTVPSLYDFTFRRLSPSQGRWISPDPAGLAVVDPANPQMWNRYAYVANNPALNTDPLGLQQVGPDCGDDFTACVDGGGDGWEPCDFTCFDGGPTGGGGYPGDGGGGVNASKHPLPCLAGSGPLLPGQSRCAPSKGPRSGYESLFCLGDALKKNGVPLALDAGSIAAGALPGGASTAGLVKTAVTAGVGSASTAYSAATSPSVSVGAANFTIGFTGTAASTIGVLDSALNGAAAFKAIPFVGTVLSLFTTGVDVTKTFMDQSSCVDSGKYD